ncbi:uncharacterized protein LOC119546244 [Drosophila subpulchrella]|uniref:uncharacterized protein LOC119546244 n=1 Tax=Drosophila subpulchrella TaxID=1486046 RepID=UPI0018A157D6|nr:uncharacterized protein LOC119546244 [Drosophila subpulchrella]
MAVDMDMEAIKTLSSSQEDASQYQSESNWKSNCKLRGSKNSGCSQKSSTSVSARKKKVIGAGCGHLLPSLAAALCILIFQLELTPPVSSMSAANETAWPPMRHYDIWDDDLGEPGDLEEESLAEEADFKLQNGIQEELDLELQQQDFSDRSFNHTNTRQGKVIHLFPVPVDGDCMSNDGRRIGNCLNAYECRQKDGQAKGECAMGFGVCCVFLASCNTIISNNITYIVSPGFPSFMPSNFSECSLRVKMMSDEISQVRIDFHHFTLGQPNRRTGVCEGDVFSIGGGPGGNFSLCGQNSGQHMYYDVGARSSPRQSTLYGSLRPVDAGNSTSNSTSTGDRFIDISLNLSSRLLPLRIWEMSVVQIPFIQRAPAGCLQYHTGTEGIMQTFNFAENGRHLANQNYRICVRQELDMCSIMYQPCDEQSFRIGGGGRMATRGGESADGSTTTSNSPVAQSEVAGGTVTATATTGSAAMTTTAPTSSTLMQMLANMANSSSATLMTMMTGNSTPAASAASSASSSSSSTAAMSTTTTTTTTPTPLRSSTEASTTSQAPASSPASDDVEGSGGEVEDDDDDGGFLFFRSRPTTEEPGVSRRPRPSGGFDIMGIIRNALDLPLKWRRRQARQFFSTCSDRITMPCIIEDFIGTGLGPLPGCEPVHCGAQFCSSGVWPCRIESTVTPFYIGVHFGNGMGAGKANAEDNVGACLRFSQVQCM